MPTLLQILAATRIGFRTLSLRRVDLATIVVTLIFLVQGTFFWFAILEGAKTYMMANADPNRVWVGSTKLPSRLSAAQVEKILQAPGIARASDGSLLADAELRSRPARTLAIGPAGTTLRPELKIIEGRMFKPGAHEIIAGIQRRDDIGQRLGQKINYDHATGWTIVGFYSTGDIMDRGYFTDAEEMKEARGEDFYHAVYLRLVSAQSFDVFKAAVEKDGTLQALREPDFVRATIADGGLARVFFNVAGILLGLGVLAATAHVMYSVVEARAEEIAILRALGFSSFAVAVSVILEAMLASLVGALTGIALAWFWLDGTWKLGMPFRVTPYLMLLGASWALGLTFIGALLPSLRAAGLTESDGLRSA